MTCVNQEIKIVSIARASNEKERRKEETKAHHSRLESLLPSVEVHRSQLSHRRTGQVNVQGLRLIDERSAIGREIDNRLL